MPALIEDHERGSLEQDWAKYLENAPAPHMTKEQFELQWAFLQSGEPHPTDPFAWGPTVIEWARRTGRLE